MKSYHVFLRLFVLVLLASYTVANPQWNSWFSESVSMAQGVLVMTGAVFLRSRTYFNVWDHCRTHFNGDTLDRCECFIRVFQELAWIAIGVAALGHATGWYKREDPLTFDDPL